MPHFQRAGFDQRAEFRRQFQQAQQVVTAVRERLTASAAAAWVRRSNSSIRRCSACASSSGVQVLALDVLDQRHPRPRCGRRPPAPPPGFPPTRPACERSEWRSPAMISQVLLRGLHDFAHYRSAGSTPCARIDLASSASLAGSMIRAAWYLPGASASDRQRAQRRPGGWPGAQQCFQARRPGPSRASSPRPSFRALVTGAPRTARSSRRITARVCSVVVAVTVRLLSVRAAAAQHFCRSEAEV